MATPNTCCGKSGQGCVWYDHCLPRLFFDTELIIGSALRKRNALAERNRLYTVPVVKQRPRTRSPDLVALAVSYLHSCSTYKFHGLAGNKANNDPGARPAGACTCDRAQTENSTPSGELCSCGSRPASESSELDSSSGAQTYAKYQHQMPALVKKQPTAISSQTRPTSLPRHNHPLVSVQV